MNVGRHVKRSFRWLKRNPRSRRLLLILVACYVAHYFFVTWNDNYGRIGTASYYDHPFHGRKTASGEIFNKFKLTAAHRQLPFGIWVKVTNLVNNKKVIVRINDRGPFIYGRIIDLSWEAARQLGMLKRGIVKVRLEILR